MKGYKKFNDLISQNLKLAGLFLKPKRYFVQSLCIRE